MASSAIDLPKFHSVHQLGLKDPSGRVSFRHMSLTFVNAEGFSASRGACLDHGAAILERGSTSPMPPTLLSTILARGYSVGGQVVWRRCLLQSEARRRRRHSCTLMVMALFPWKVVPTGKCFVVFFKTMSTILMANCSVQLS